MDSPYKPSEALSRNSVTSDLARTSSTASWLGFGLGILAAPIALILAMYSSGGGHGDYGFARALFPIPMLLTRITDNTISIPSLALALIQFPAYGVVLGKSVQRGRKQAILTFTLLAMIQGIATACAFTGWLPNFSR